MSELDAAIAAYNAVWEGWSEPIDAGNVDEVRRAAMTAALAAQQDGAWQPIETAPKDGTVIDVWCGDPRDGYRITDAFYGKPYHQCMSQYCDSCPPDRTVKKWREPMNSSPIKPTFWRQVKTPAQS